jgi:hypothetical protein
MMSNVSVPEAKWRNRSHEIVEGRGRTRGNESHVDERKEPAGGHFPERARWREALRAHARAIKWGALLAVVAVGVVILLWKVPQLQTNDLGRSESAQLEQRKLENEYRRTLATIVAGVFVFLSVVLTWLNVRIAQQNAAVMRDGQITERFTKAIELLGATHADGTIHFGVRLGGIYALERIARDSVQRDNRAVMDVLTAYVRENAPNRSHAVNLALGPWQNPMTDSPRSIVPPRRVPGNLFDQIPGRRADVDAIVAVLGRRTEAQRADYHLLDLSYSDLRGLRLGSGVYDNISLEKSDLRNTKFRLTSFIGVSFEEANLEGADVRGANFEGAVFVRANLQRVRFGGANLAHASFLDAKLQGADLSEVKGLVPSQITHALVDDQTKLPFESGENP